MTSYIAYNLNNEIRKNSSSGGVFYSLAKYILENNGVVFGAAWNKDWLVDMCYVDNLKDLPKLMGSKYIQADSKSTFKECKEFLDAGKLVLYSGLPCQLHGLKKYLGKDYDNLYLVDIACHGLMPLQVWKDYLETIKRPDADTISIKFRLKEPDWSNFAFEVKYSNGKILKEHHRNNKYMQVFLCDKYLKSSCYDCKFKNNFSISDLCIGDAWGVKINWDKKDGISFIHVYTDHGKELLDKLTDLEVLPYEYINMPNGCLNNKLKTAPAQYNKSIVSNKQCGIISLPLHGNIGGYLQSYALKKTIENLGYNCDVINYKPNWYKGEVLPFIKEIAPITIADKNSYKKILAKHYDTLVVGSDQIWRPKYAENLKDTFLNFARNINTTNKISYAASFGSDDWEYTKEQTEMAKILLTEFSAVSVRELNGIYFCDKYFETKATQVLDPTLLLDKQVYLDLCKDIPVANTEKAFTYFLDNSDNYKAALVNRGIDIVDCDRTNIYDWLAHFRDCKYIITDSYHGCLFSIIFNKPFICIENKNRGLARFNTLKKLFGLSDNFISNIHKLPEESQITLPDIIKKLKLLRNQSIKWLAKNLQNPPKAVELADRVKKLKVCLCGIGKLENNYIKEWVNHYKALGFDKIFLIDNNDIDGEHFEDVIGDYINSGYVQLIDKRGLRNQQICTYDELYNNGTFKGFDWVAYFDIDEFMYIDGNKTIKELLAKNRYDNFNCIAINWKYFDDNNLVAVENNNYSVKDRFTHAVEEDKDERKFTKRILRYPLSNIIINSSHGPITRTSINESIYCTTLTNDYVYCCNVAGRYVPDNHTKIIDWSWDGAHLRHYRFKTIEEYVTNKMKRGYPTLYKNEGKDLNLTDFFRLNAVTQEKLDWLDMNNIPYDKKTLLPPTTKKIKVTQVNNIPIAADNKKHKVASRSRKYIYF